MSEHATTNGKSARTRNDGGVEVESVVCDNCGSSSYTVVSEGRDHEYPHTATGTFRIVRCACGLLYLNPRPATSELDTIYPPDYYAYQIVEQRLRRGNGSLLGRFMERRAVGRWRRWADLVPPREDRRRRMLDIGCGDGTVLNQWREAFDGDVETHGVEMNAKAAAIAEAQGHRVMAKRIEECDLEEGAYDLVVSFHVIEHVTEPTSFMRAIHRALRPDGFVLIDTPNVDTFDFRLFSKRHWGGYHFPRHFFLYDERTFTALAKKAGFEVVRFEYCPSAIFWVWTMHSILHDRHPRLAARLFPPVDVFLRGSPWIWLLMSVFTAVDVAATKITGKTAFMRVLLRKA